MTKHSLLSLWSGLEGVKGTHRMTGSLSQLSFRRGQGQEEVRAPWVGGGLECQAPGELQLLALPPQSSQFREGRGLRRTSPWVGQKAAH